ncbi:MAG: chemotaxis protein CheB [Coxiellaceae bacterium]|nr:chemotaxis protein CheB [Coxiellaceae bacterium]
MLPKMVVMGASAGGFDVLKMVLTALPKDFSVPIVIVQHMGAECDDYMAIRLNELSDVHVKQAADKEKALSGTAYIAPGNYHLLIEGDGTLSLSIDERIRYCRPSIDVLFESAADAYGEEIIAVVMTGANDDGSHGAALIKKYDGIVIVQDPETAHSPCMPSSVIKATTVDYVVDADKIAPILCELLKQGQADG